MARMKSEPLIHSATRQPGRLRNSALAPIWSGRLWRRPSRSRPRWCSSRPNRVRHRTRRSSEACHSFADEKSQGHHTALLALAESVSASLRRALRPAGVITIYLVLGLVAYWPVLPGISHRLFSQTYDHVLSVWFIGWIPHAKTKRARYLEDPCRRRQIYCDDRVGACTRQSEENLVWHALHRFVLRAAAWIRLTALGKGLRPKKCTTGLSASSRHAPAIAASVTIRSRRWTAPVAHAITARAVRPSRFA